MAFLLPLSSRSVCNLLFFASSACQQRQHCCMLAKYLFALQCTHTHTPYLFLVPESICIAHFHRNSPRFIASHIFQFHLAMSFWSMSWYSPYPIPCFWNSSFIVCKIKLSDFSMLLTFISLNCNAKYTHAHTNYIKFIHPCAMQQNPCASCTRFDCII